MLKNWKDSVGANVTTKVNECIKTYNGAVEKVNCSIRELNSKTNSVFKITFNKKRILSLKA